MGQLEAINNTQISSSVLEESSDVIYDDPIVEEPEPLEENETDPKVCHEPIQKNGVLIRLYTSEEGNKDNYAAAWNSVNNLLTDGIKYPILYINDRAIEPNCIINFKLLYTNFLPSIIVTIRDDNQRELKINSTQMSGTIQTCITSPVDKVYRKILLAFRIDNVYVDNNNPTFLTYYGTLDVPGFRTTYSRTIWMKDMCNGEECKKSGEVNANTWEFLHELAKISGLGFSATKETKNINDRALRNITTQRINNYIEEQIKYSGVDEDSILDAWVDLYGYIVLVNVSYIFNKNILSNDLKIIANYGLNSTTELLPPLKPIKVNRLLTNWPLMPTVSNMTIKSYVHSIDNNILYNGTLERTNMIQLNGKKTKLNLIDIQVRQNSLEGQNLENYNTSKNMPIPKFNFNHPNYTGFKNDYDMNFQEKLRTLWFMNKRQNILKVRLSQLNLGLQRGTLVNLAIADNDVAVKYNTMNNTSTLFGEEDKIEADEMQISYDENNGAVLYNDKMWVINPKLSGIYYIDGMEFEYDRGSYNEIVQILYLIKKGPLTGFGRPRVPSHLMNNSENSEESEQFMESLNKDAQILSNS